MDWIWYKLLNSTHGHGYDLNLEFDDMCSLMESESLDWWHYEINMKICALCVENEIVYVHYDMVAMWK